MRFVNDFSTGEAVILKRFPEFRNMPMGGDDSGWDNFAIQVDNRYLFRFPRREDALEQIKQEIEVLNNLKVRLPDNIKVPDYLVCQVNHDYPFVYYEMIQGEPLDLQLYQNLEESKKDMLAQNLARFLNILHATDLQDCPALKTIEAQQNYQDFYQQIIEVCFKYLNPQEQTKTKLLFANYFNHPMLQQFTPTVVHGDLSGNHVLITENGIGVIDFGDTSIFDPAIDLSWIYLLDKGLYHKILPHYSARKDSHFEQRIREFYIPIIPYYGVIYGEETNDQKLIEGELKDLKRNLAEF